MAPKKNYTPEQMMEAIKRARNGTKPTVAARECGVPRVTLLNKLNGKSPLNCSMGPKTILTTNEENILAEWIIAMNNQHMPVTKTQLLDSVQRIIKDKKQETPFKNNRPGEKWYELFLKRHPQISVRTPQNLTSTRDSVTEENIRNWFAEVYNYMVEKDLTSILQDPSRIFNTDESAFYLSPTSERVLAQKGEKHVYKNSGDEKENLTVLITGNALGQLAPPLVVFPYERIPSAVASNFPSDWAIGKSENGWMCGETFYEYMANIFNGWVEENKIKKPILFFLDGHSSHMTLHLSRFCSDNKIVIISLYPNATHILQPMDVSIFRPLKLQWKKAVADWRLDNQGEKLKKEHFASVLKKALNVISPDCLKNGFRKCGLFPFGADYVDMTKIKTSNRQEKTENEAVVTEDALFLNKIEHKIVKLFNKEKLELFKRLYFLPRNQLELELPSEDLSLYLIWASLNHVVPLNTSLETININSSSLIEVEKPPNNPISCGSDHATTIQQLDPLCAPQQSRTLVDQLNSVELISRQECSHLCEPSNSNAPQASVTDNATAVSASYATPEKPTNSQLPISVIGPSTSRLLPNIEVPSPFKRTLFWPEPRSNKQNKRIKREKLPAVITSDAWIAYHENKENAKKKLQVEKEKRAKEREEKKILKEINEQLKKKKKRQELKKRKVQETSSESDTNVQYADSTDSEWYEFVNEAKEYRETERKKTQINSSCDDSDLEIFK